VVLACYRLATRAISCKKCHNFGLWQLHPHIQIIKELHPHPKKHWQISDLNAGATFSLWGVSGQRMWTLSILMGTSWGSVPLPRLTGLALVAGVRLSDSLYVGYT